MALMQPSCGPHVALVASPDSPRTSAMPSGSEAKLCRASYRAPARAGYVPSEGRAQHTTPYPGGGLGHPGKGWA